MQFFKIDVGSEAGEAVIYTNDGLSSVIARIALVNYSLLITRSYIDMVFFVTKLSG